MTNPENDWIKSAAAEEFKSLSDMRSRILDEHSHTFRWLIGSLLAINGGAAIAALNSELIPAYFKILSGICFGLGIIAALLIGVIAQRVGVKTLRPLAEYQGYWLSVIDNGELDEELEAQYKDMLRDSSRWAWTSPAMGWISAILFIGGLAFMGTGLVRYEQMAQEAERIVPKKLNKPISK